MDKNNNAFRYHVRVFYEDTDAGGIVYYANYLKFAERARTEWLRAMGINQSYFLEQRLGFVVTKVDMENKASAKLDDLLTVITTIPKLKKASLQFKQDIVNQNNTLLCTVVVNVACVDLEKAKPCPIPQVILGALTSAR